MDDMPHSLVRARALLVVLLALGTAGCEKRSASQAVDEALQRAAKSRREVYPLAGKITTDGHALALRPASRIFVMLHDRDKLDAATGPLLKTVCKPDGEFVFSTYLQGDGVPAGKYVVTIAQLRQGFRQGYVGPDVLKNLYNDPDANAKIDEFVIDHKPPGKTDYALDLQIEGREPANPGPHAVTKIRP